MSIESARRVLRDETVEAVCIGQMKQSWYAALDRLILEVQAELPCYWTRDECAQMPCPSCKARAALEVQT